MHNHADYASLQRSISMNEFLKALGERLKAKGLDLAEDMVMMIAVEFEAELIETLKKSDGKLDDMAIPVIEAIMPFVKSKIDMVDGKIG